MIIIKLKKQKMDIDTMSHKVRMRHGMSSLILLNGRLKLFKGSNKQRT